MNNIQHQYIEFFLNSSPDVALEWEVLEWDVMAETECIKRKIMYLLGEWEWWTIYSGRYSIPDSLGGGGCDGGYHGQDGRNEVNGVWCTKA